jgi:hypothetical protein
MLGGQAELHGRQGAVQLVTVSRTDDRCGDGGPAEQPGQGQCGRCYAKLLCQVLLVGPEFVSMLSEALRRAALASPNPVSSFLITPPSRPPCSGDQGMIPRP